MILRHAGLFLIVVCQLQVTWIGPLYGRETIDTDPDFALEQELYNCAPAILTRLLEKRCQSVGFLKFRVSKGDAPLSDNVGTFNMYLCERLKVAMIFAAQDLPGRRLQIIKNANEVARKFQGVTHLTEPGRQALYSAHGYEVAWNEAPPAQVDAFLTGVAMIPKGQDHVHVVLMAFDRFKPGIDPKRETVAEFFVPLTPEILTEISEPLVMRGAFHDGQPVLKSDPEDTEKRTRKALDDCIRLEILYDDQPQLIAFQGGRATVRAPQQGQSVHFSLANVSQRQERLAVVLKVNGENTIGRQRRKDVDCAKWILEPDASSIIRGYLKEPRYDTAEAFVVLSPQASKLAEMNYGADVGTISITVFGEATNQYIAPVTDEAEDLAAIANPSLPAERPQSLTELQAVVRRSQRDIGTRGLRSAGLIEGGMEITQPTELVPFECARQPMLTATIHYYTPQASSELAR